MFDGSPLEIPLAAIGIGLVLLGAGLAPTAGAHNPADTIFHPAPIEERLLVVGGEGTYALLSPTGEVRDRGNLSGEGEVIAAPVVSGATAATLVRSFPDLTPHLQAFDERGPAWRLQVAGEGERGFVVAGGEGFAVFTTDGRQLLVDRQGRVQADHELPAPAQARPAASAEGGWWVPLADELVRVVDGDPVDRRPLGNATPTDVRTSEHGVLVSLAQRGAGQAEVVLFDDSLSKSWSRSLDGLRLGGSPAVLEETIVVATYDPDGARVLAFQASDGTLAWEREIGDATAAAPAALGERLVLATTEGVLAHAGDGTRLWEHEARPYLESPAVVEDLVIPSSADNRLVALHPDGSQAWTWTDGVEMPPWSHHGEDEAADDGGKAPVEAEEVPGPGPGAVSLLALGAALARRRRRQG